METLLQNGAKMYIFCQIGEKNFISLHYSLQEILATYINLSVRIRQNENQKHVCENPTDMTT